MNNENEEENNTIITKSEWSVKEYCCDNMRHYIEGESVLNYKLNPDGHITYSDSYRSVYVNFCPNCGAKVITKR